MLLLLRGGFPVATVPLLRLQLSTPFRRFFQSRMSAVTEPVHRRFIRVDNKEESTISSSIESDDGLRFRIVSYNILAQVFVKSAYFPHSPKACLRWKARSEKVLTSLKSFKADFLCIQELDEYDTFYKINMENHGYSSIFIQRSGKKRDGCGIFYTRNSAELVLQEEIEYNDLVDSVQDGTSLSVNKFDDAPVDGNTPINDLPPKDSLNDRGDPNDPRVRLKRDCVGIMGAFKHKDFPDHIVIVANTHLYWDPAWADVKLAQAKYLLSRLAQFKAVVSDKFGCTPSVIVSGDFNSTPGDKVYQYIVSGDSSVSPSADDNSEMTPIPLRSVYAFAGGEPPFTNCTPGFTGTLDYIFFSPSGHLKPVSFLELPGPESSDVVGGLPNNHHPSDHLPIGADFEVTSISNQLENMSISNQLENMSISNRQE